MCVWGVAGSRRPSRPAAGRLGSIEHTFEYARTVARRLPDVGETGHEEGEERERTLVVWCPDWPVTAVRWKEPVDERPGDGTPAWSRTHARSMNSPPVGVARAPIASDPVGAARSREEEPLGGSGPPFDEELLAVVDGQWVLAVSPAARRSGVSVGQRRRVAEECCPDLVVRERDPRQEMVAFETVISAVASVCDELEVLEPGCLAFLVRRSARRLGGERHVVAAVDAALARIDAARPPGPDQPPSDFSPVGEDRPLPSKGTGAGGGRREREWKKGEGARGREGPRARPTGTAEDEEVGDEEVGDEDIKRRTWWRCGVARGLPAAVLAARLGVVVPVGHTPAFLSRLPLSTVIEIGPSLGLGRREELTEFVGLCGRLGVTTLGDLARLDADDVVGRFGDRGARLQAVARGEDTHRRHLWPAPADRSVRAELDPPAEDVGTVAFALRALAGDLTRQLAEEGVTATAVAVTVESEHGERLACRWRHDGVLKADLLAERVRWQVERWRQADPGERPTAGVTLVILAAEEVVSGGGRQLDFFGHWRDADERAARSFIRIQGILGEDAVWRGVPSGGRGPAAQARWVRWPDGEGPGGEESEVVTRRPVPARRPVVVGWPGRLPAPFPVLVPTAHLAIAVVERSGASVQIDGRGLLGGAPVAVRPSPEAAAWLVRLGLDVGVERPVVAWAGPWPMEERWWERTTGGPWRRVARLQLLLEGGEAWLVAREGGGWRLEGVYD